MNSDSMASSKREAVSARHLRTSHLAPARHPASDGWRVRRWTRPATSASAIRSATRRTSPASASRRGAPAIRSASSRTREAVLVRRRSGADLDLALAGLHADRDRSERRLHHLVCWRLPEEGRERAIRLALARFEFPGAHHDAHAHCSLASSLSVLILGRLHAEPRPSSSSSTMRCARSAAASQDRGGQDDRHRRHGRELQPRAGHEARSRDAAVRDHRLQARRSTSSTAGSASSRRARRSSPTSRARSRRRRSRSSTATSPSTSTPQGQRRGSPALAERDRRIDFFHHPLTLLRAAIDPQTTVTNVRTVGNVRQADFTTSADRL